MQRYTLENKKMDEDFLSGSPVTGRAVLPASGAKPVKEGDFLLVVLSNGKKYKGKVTKFSFFMLKDYHIGEIEFMRTM